MPHISFRVTDAEKEQYRELPAYERKDLTTIIKAHLAKLLRKHGLSPKK